MKETVFLGLSGGVDSAVSAYLLLQAGYKVVGVFMRNWAGSDGKDPECTQKVDRDSAEAVAHSLGIEFMVMDFVDNYMESVMKPFVEAYKAGLTPNPDVLCNSDIKFGVFKQKSLDLGADKVATGHYAGVLHDDRSGAQLLLSADVGKDQTYFLSALKTEQLYDVVFPLSNLTKQEVREIADSINLPNATKKDSQGICFVGKINVREYLRDAIGDNTGDIVDIETGRVLGKHQGVWSVTIGQRHGLDIGGISTPYYVCSKDAEHNTVYACQGHDNPLLYKTKISITNLNLIGNDISIETLSGRSDLYTRIRHRGDMVQIKSISYDNSDRTVTISHSEPHWAVASGQTLAIYDDKRCYGSGVVI